MKKRTYFITVSTVFVVVATVHFLRIVYGWPLEVGGLSIPMWVSWFGVIFIGSLAYHGFILQKRG